MNKYYGNSMYPHPVRPKVCWQNKTTTTTTNKISSLRPSLIKMFTLRNCEHSHRIGETMWSSVKCYGNNIKGKIQWLTIFACLAVLLHSQTSRTYTFATWRFRYTKMTASSIIYRTRTWCLNNKYNVSLALRCWRYANVWKTNPS